MVKFFEGAQIRCVKPMASCFVVDKLYDVVCDKDDNLCVMCDDPWAPVKHTLSNPRNLVCFELSEGPW